MCCIQLCTRKNALPFRNTVCEMVTLNENSSCKTWEFFIVFFDSVFWPAACEEERNGHDRMVHTFMWRRTERSWPHGAYVHFFVFYLFIQTHNPWVICFCDVLMMSFFSNILSMWLDFCGKKEEDWKLMANEITIIHFLSPNCFIKVGCTAEYEINFQ